MSGFNTKERNNNGEYEITFYTENHEDFKKVQDLCRELIDHDKPVSTEGDLISREALKKEIFEHCRSEEEILNHFWYDENLIAIIDNAPTVEAYTFEQVKELFELSVQMANEIENLKRPTGKWINHRNDNGHNIADCSLCGKATQWHDEDEDGTPRYCWYCGASMKGGEE